jgi:transposase-like protein
MVEETEQIYADFPDLVELTGMPECPVCESQFAEFMGALGSRAHFRCGACGSDYSEPLDTT